VRDLAKYAAPFVFDVYSSRPAAARWLFSGFPACRACYDEASSWDDNRRNYPLGLWVNQFVSIHRDGYDPAGVRAVNSVLADVAAQIDRMEPDYDLFITTQPRTDGLLARRSTFLGLTRSRISHAVSGLAYGGDALDVGKLAGALERFELDGRPYVTVHNGFDLDLPAAPGAKPPPTDRSTRAYPAFDRVVALVKAEFRELTMVQIGGQSSEPIPRADVQLINRTSLGETAEILRGAMLHLDSEGGLVHLAAAVGTRSCVVFGPTPVAYLAYKDNINLPPPVCGDCWWTTDAWQSDCPRGLARPQCLYERTPESVVAAARPALAAALAAAGKRGGLRDRLGLRLGVW